MKNNREINKGELIRVHQRVGDVNMKKILSIIFTLLLLIKVSKKMWTIVGLLFPHLGILKQNATISIAVFILCLILLGCSHWRMRTNDFLLFIVLIFTLLISAVTNSTSTQSFFSQFYILFDSYSLVLVAILLNNQSMRMLNWRSVEATILVFVTLQALLGISQFISKSPIVPIMDASGDPVVNSIYYVNGASSNKAYFMFQAGAKLRAFGMTDSGFTFGLLMLLGLVVILKRREIKPWLRGLLAILYSVGIYCSYTRIIMFALFGFLILKVVSKKHLIFIKFTYFFGVVSQLGIMLLAYTVTSMQVMSSSTFWGSIVSRIQGIMFYTEHYSLNLIHFLFGFNNVVNSSNINTIYSIDNDTLNIYFDIGILGLLVIEVFFASMLLTTLRERATFYQISSFMAVLALIGIVNSPYYFIAFLMILFEVERYSDGTSIIGSEIDAGISIY